MNKHFSYLALLLIPFTFSCEYENAEIEISKSKVDFERDIVPILTNHCNLNGCHINGATTGDFTDYNQLKEKIDNGKFQIMVFDYKLMPPASSSQLSQNEYSVLHRWVDQGALI